MSTYYVLRKNLLKLVKVCMANNAFDIFYQFKLYYATAFNSKNT